MDFIALFDELKWKTLAQAQALFADCEDADALEAQAFLALFGNLYTAGEGELTLSFAENTIEQTIDLLRRAAASRSGLLGEVGKIAISYALLNSFYSGGSILQFYSGRRVRLLFSAWSNSDQESLLLDLAEELCSSSFAASLYCAYGQMYKGERLSEAKAAWDSFAPFVSGHREDTIRRNADAGDVHAARRYALLIRERKDSLSIKIRMLNVFSLVPCIICAFSGMMLLLLCVAMALFLLSKTAPMTAFLSSANKILSLWPVLTPVQGIAVSFAAFILLGFISNVAPERLSFFFVILGVTDLGLISYYIMSFLSNQFPEIFPELESHPNTEPNFFDGILPYVSLLMVGLVFLIGAVIWIRVLLHKRDALVRRYDPADVVGAAQKKPVAQPDMRKAEQYLKKAYQLDESCVCDYAQFLHRARRKKEAKELLSRAIEQNDSRAMMAMRDLFFVSSRDELLQKAADLGNADAFLALSMEKSNHREYIERAAELGSVAAMRWLSEKLARGSWFFHIKKDPVKAFEYAQKAAESGHPDGLAQLGWCYEHGVGVPKQPEKAVQCYQDALSMGGEYSDAWFRMTLAGALGHHDSLSNAAVAVEKDSDRIKEDSVKEGALNGTISLEEVRRIYEELTAESAALREKLRHDETVFIDYIKKQEEATKFNAVQHHSDEYSQSEEYLKERFGDGWERLSEDARVCLVSARTLLYSTELYNDRGFDYSGVSITASSALEYELKRLFFILLMQRFQEKYGKEWKKWPYQFHKYRNKNGEADFSKFTLGNFPYILGCKFPDKHEFNDEQKSVVADYLKQIIREDTYTEQPLDALTKPIDLPGMKTEKTYVDLIDDICNRHRNPAAHTHRINRADAQACYRAVAGAEDDISRVESALDILLFLLKP